MLLTFLICILILVVLEPKIVGAIFYWGFLLGVGLVGFMAFVLYAVGAG